MKKRWILFLLAVLFGFTGFAKTVNVGLVVDGKSEGLLKAVAVLKEEIKSLASEDTEVVFLADKQIFCEFDSQKIAVAIDSLNKDKEVDICFLVGTLSSKEGFLANNLDKPFIAGELLNFKPNSKISENFYFSHFKQDFYKNIIALLNTLNYKNTLIVGSNLYFNSIDDFQETIAKEFYKNAIECDFFKWNGVDVGDLTDRIKNKDCVIVVDSGFYSDEQVHLLVDFLSKKQTPVFSNEKRFVKAGGVCAFDIENRSVKTAKHLAVMFDSVCEKEKKENFNFLLDENLQLFVNSNSFSKVNCYLPFSMLLDATDIGDKNKNRKALTLKKAVELSVKNNLEVEIEKRDTSIEKANLKAAKSNLKPQVDLSLTGLKLDKKSTTYVLNIPENSIKGEIFLTQVLYSEDANNYISIEKYLVEAKKYKLQTKVLDTMLKTCNAYINVLKAKSILRILKEDLEVKNKNLQLAKIRNEKGVSSPSDVYRWESIIAITKSKVLLAKVNLKNAREEFFRVLNIKSFDNLTLSDLDYKEKMLFVNSEKMFKLLDNPHSLKILENFLIQNFNTSSPELKAYDKLIDASKRELKAAKRGYFAPTVALVGSYSEVLDKWGAGTTVIPLPPEFGAMLPEVSDKRWYFGVSVKFSPFKGGKKAARKIKATETLYKTKAEKEDLEEKIKSNLRVLIYKLRTSLDSIKLAESAKNAAYKNLKLVQDAYKEGLVDITSLMDAQNAYISAKEYYKNTVYTFVSDYLTIDRIATGLISFQGEHVKNELLTKLENFKNNFDKERE